MEKRSSGGEPIVIDVHLRLEIVGVPRDQVRLNVIGPAEVNTETEAVRLTPKSTQATPPPPEHAELPKSTDPPIDPSRMLVISRKKNESIVINNDITVVVIEIRGDKVRLGIEAPTEFPVHRKEVYDAIIRNEARTPGGIFS